MQMTIDLMYNSLEKCFKPDNQIMPLNAIWLDKAIRVFNEHSTPQVRLVHRIAKGDILGLNDDGGICDYLSGEDWQILAVMGTVDSSVLQLQLKNVNSDEIKTVNL